MSSRGGAPHDASVRPSAVPAPGKKGNYIYLATPCGDTDYDQQTRVAAIASAYAVQVWVEEGRAVFSPRTHEQGLLAANYAWCRVVHDRTDVDAFNLAILSSCVEVRVLTFAGWDSAATLSAELAEARRRRIPITYVDPERTGFSFPRASNRPSAHSDRINRPR